MTAAALALAASLSARAVPAAVPTTRTIVWLAAADARGHLMRAHLLRAALAPRGVAVRILTTSHEGRAFLAALGARSELLSTHYAVLFDGRQNMRRAATEARVARYLVSRARAGRDLATLRAACDGADLLVNDFHPLPFIAPGHVGARVVHVVGSHLWDAIAHPFVGRAPDAVDRLGARVAGALRGRAFACLEHSLLHASAGGDRVLPPIVAAPARWRSQVRGALGAGAGQRLAAVYLNPHFRDARLAEAIEGALARRGFRMHAVGEGLASRPGWRAYDAAFNDVAAAADVLVSAPGMGALSAWAHFGTPLLAVLTDQPEQAANLRDLAAVRAAPYAVVRAAEATPDAFDRALADVTAIARGPRPDPAAVASAVQARWADALCGLLSTRLATRT